jgi:hypothetical protein
MSTKSDATYWNMLTRIGSHLAFYKIFYADRKLERSNRYYRRAMRLVNFLAKWSRKQGYNEGYAAGIKDSVRQFCCMPSGDIREQYEL